MNRKYHKTQLNDLPQQAPTTRDRVNDLLKCCERLTFNQSEAENGVPAVTGNLFSSGELQRVNDDEEKAQNVAKTL